ncbi:hypothetical protein NL676_018512 [Syzygium grande]|nr:hypothetical protein NL676_018512 [Syzygium grande]
MEYRGISTLENVKAEPRGSAILCCEEEEKASTRARARQHERHYSIPGEGWRSGAAGGLGRAGVVPEKTTRHSREESTWQHVFRICLHIARLPPPTTGEDRIDLATGIPGDKSFIFLAFF